MWVVGEVARVRHARSGHVYFELVEKGDGDKIEGKLEAVIWRSDWRRVETTLRRADQSLTEGVEIRCRGSVDFYPPFGRLSLIVREVDPTFALGLLARRRQETLAALAAQGLLEANQQVPFPALPLRIALVTSEGSAAYHDFLTTLQESGYPFQVLLLHAAVQGKAAEREVTSALRTAVALGGKRVDVVALIRGGGSRSDLAAFDSRAIAEAVARCPLPVLTGLGHEIDEAIADRVAHQAFKTPTKVAEALVEVAERLDLYLEDAARSVARTGRERLRAGREAVYRAQRGVQLAGQRLGRADDRLRELGRTLGRLSRRRLAEEGRRRDGLGRRLSRAAPRLLARAAPVPEHQGRRLVAAGSARLRQAETRLDGLARVARQLDPERVLQRGFSLTLTAQGTVLRHASEVTPGDRLTTRLARGRVVSEAREIEAGGSPPGEEQ